MKNIEDIVKSLSDVDKDRLYRRLWLDYVIADVIDFCENNDIPYTDEDFPDKVARRYVYDNKYDCNLSYWTNIENLVETVRNEV